MAYISLEQEDAGASVQDWVLDTHDDGGDASAASDGAANRGHAGAPIASAPANSTGNWQPQQGGATNNWQPQQGGAIAYSPHSHSQQFATSSPSEVHVDVSPQPVPMQQYGASHEPQPSEFEQQQQQQQQHLPPTIHAQHEHQPHQSESASQPMMYAAMGADQ